MNSKVIVIIGATDCFGAYPRRVVVALTQHRRIGDVSLTTGHHLARKLRHVNFNRPVATDSRDAFQH